MKIISSSFFDVFTKAFTLLFLFFFIGYYSNSQELYVFSNPASNVPARSVSLKYGSKWIRGNAADHSYTGSRHMLESQLGLSKKLMLKTGFSFSNMYTHKQQQLESGSLYAKYRFLSKDAVHSHFRAAAFINAVISRNDLKYEELTGDGDHSVIQAGIVFTQLIKKLALSGTVAHTEIINSDRWKKYIGSRNFGYQGINYNFSGGYLLYPRKYTSYKQTNINLYVEIIGGAGLDRSFSYTDLAPAVQFIMNSNTKVNMGYRFQLKGDVYRMARSGVYFSVERTFLNVLKKRG
ncbi:MAG: hypothetical protein ACK5AO_07750 [bacterium]